MLNIVSSSRYKINRKLVKKVMFDVLTKYGIPNNAIFNLVFIGKKKMKDIATKYKKERVALPVLSFSYNDRSLTPEVKEDFASKGDVNTSGAEMVVGEIFICYPQAVLLAAERQKKVDVIMSQLIEHGLENILK